MLIFDILLHCRQRFCASGHGCFVIYSYFYLATYEWVCIGFLLSYMTSEYIGFMKKLALCIAQGCFWLLAYTLIAAEEAISSIFSMDKHICFYVRHMCSYSRQNCLILIQNYRKLFINVFKLIVNFDKVKHGTCSYECYIWCFVCYSYV